MNTIDETARRAEAAAVQRTWKARIGRFVREAPDFLRDNLPMAIMIGAWAGIFAWEVANTTDGFRRAFPDRSEWMIHFIGFACPLGFMIAYRIAAEGFRAKRTHQGALFALMTAIMFAVTGFFTFSNFVGETQVVSQIATETNEDRQAIRDRIRRLDRELVSMPAPISLDADRELLAARVAEAAGWGLADLEPEGACKADLKPRPRFLCNDAAVIRDDIIRGEAMLEAKAAKRVEIEAAEAELEALKLAEAGAQYRAMSAMVGGRVSAEVFSSWLLLIVAVAFLIADAVFGDYILERRERRETGGV